MPSALGNRTGGSGGQEKWEMEDLREEGPKPKKPRGITETTPGHTNTQGEQRDAVGPPTGETWAWTRATTETGRWERPRPAPRREPRDGAGNGPRTTEPGRSSQPHFSTIRPEIAHARLDH